MFNEAKPFYIKHLTPPLFLTHQIVIFSSDLYRSSENKPYQYESILSPKVNLIAKSQSHLKKHIFSSDIHLSSKIIFL